MLLYTLSKWSVVWFSATCIFTAWNEGVKAPLSTYTVHQKWWFKSCQNCKQTTNNFWNPNIYWYLVYTIKLLKDVVSYVYYVPWLFITTWLDTLALYKFRTGTTKLLLATNGNIRQVYRPIFCNVYIKANLSQKRANYLILLPVSELLHFGLVKITELL